MTRITVVHDPAMWQASDELLATAVRQMQALKGALTALVAAERAFVETTGLEPTDRIAEAVAYAEGVLDVCEKAGRR